MLPFRNVNLPIDERVKDLVARLTVDEKIALLPTRQKAIPRLGLREFSLGGEGAHGVVDRDGVETTVFPQPIALASTWDAQLLKKIGAAIGTEARVLHEKEGKKARLALWFPTVDMLRDPRWGRTEEGYGEDPFHTGQLAAALVRGAQGDDPTFMRITCAPKHFFANNTEENRASYNAVITNRDKHEYYLRVFEYVYKNGMALSMMTAYNEINGRPCLLLDELRTLVKGQWGCESIVCDGGDFSQTVTEHGYFKTHAQSMAAALRSGVDSFPEKPGIIITAAKKALKDNLIRESDIDAAVFNTLKMRFRLGEFDDNHPYAKIPAGALLSDKHNSLSQKAAKEAVVLLKNDGFLPLTKAEKTLVVGEIADNLYPGWYEGTCARKSSVLSALKARIGEDNVIYDDLCDTVSFYDEEAGGYITTDDNGVIGTTANYAGRSVFREHNWGFGSFSYYETRVGKYLTCVRYAPQTDPAAPFKADGVLEVTSDRVYGWFNMELFVYDEDSSCFFHEGTQTKWKKTYEHTALERVLEKAEKASCIIINAGNHPLINGRECVDREDITLPKRERAFIRELAKVNKNVALVITAGYPYAISEEESLVRAVLYTGQGSQNLGNAVTGALFGDFSPAGRLSVTWYKDARLLPPIDDYQIINKRTYMYTDKNVLYPFGYGLSYTSFEYSAFNISKSRFSLSRDKTVRISFRVTNTGSMQSDEVSQVYFKALSSSAPRPIKQLCGFTRFSLKPGQSKDVIINIPLNAFMHYDTSSARMITETGDYELMIGASSEDIRLSGVIHLDGQTVGKRRGVISALDYDDAVNITHIEDKYRHTITACKNTREEAVLVYKNCGLTGKEQFFNARCGEGCEGFLALIAGDKTIADVSASASLKVRLTPFEPADVIMIKLKDKAALRDFWLE